jgi:excisionase family DNA binding protein
MLVVPIADACTELGCSKPTIYRWAKEGRISLVRRAGRTYITPAELARFNEAETRDFVPGERVIANAGGHRKP